MKRALIVALISGALALSSALPSVVGAAPLDLPAPAPEATLDATPCPPVDGPSMAAGGGCCQRQGGICGCRGRQAKCCNGTMSDGCACRGNSPSLEFVHDEVPS
jgi:hypothetical protein